MAVAGCGNGGTPTCEHSAAERVCAGPAQVKGIDVSTYQSKIDWAKVRADGVEFAVARVSDGLTHPDDQFSANWKGMRDAGVLRGVYQFFRAGQDPLAQADLVLGKLAAEGAPDLPVVMDIETTDGQTDAVVRTQMQRWLDRMHTGGARTMIYTANFMSGTVGTGFAAEPLWVANYGATCPLMPTGWSQWIFWQSSDSGHVAGIGPAVDLDQFNGTRAQLDDFVNAGKMPPTTMPPVAVDGGCP